jgi:predicted HicB family RNase H-like nuclease
MPSIHIRIPDPLHQQAKAKADEWGISLNQMLVVLVAQGLEPRVLVQCEPTEEPS